MAEYRKCDFCKREFENPTDWYTLDDGTDVCEYCIPGLEEFAEKE